MPVSAELVFLCSIKNFLLISPLLISPCSKSDTFSIIASFLVLLVFGSCRRKIKNGDTEQMRLRKSPHQIFRVLCLVSYLPVEDPFIKKSTMGGENKKK